MQNLNISTRILPNRGLIKCSKILVCVKIIFFYDITVICYHLSNIQLLSAVLLLDSELPEFIQGEFGHNGLLRQLYFRHNIMYVRSLAVRTLLCNSQVKCVRY